MDNLYNKLLEYIKSTKDQECQFKPSQHQIDINKKLSRTNVDAELEIIKKDHTNQIDHHLYNICENIVFSFFGLQSKKFYQVMLRVKEWGLQICLQQFIMNYYLFIKQNSRLRQFILLHFNKIVLTSCSIIETQLIKKMNLQSFTSNNSALKMLNQKLADTEKQLLDLMPQQDINKKIVEPIKSESDAAKLKAEILADLKAQNKELEDI